MKKPPTKSKELKDVPLPDDWKNWESQHAKLISEIDLLRNRIALLESTAKEDPYQVMLERINELTEQRDGAYAERDRCVVGLAALAVHLGWSAWLGQHEGDSKWDQEYMTVVFINLPTGQVSWHIHDSEVAWFSFLPTILDRHWDGHTTLQKYDRLAGLVKYGVTP